MKPDWMTKHSLQILIVIGAVVVLWLAALSMNSLFRLFRPPAEITRETDTPQAADKNASPEQQAKSAPVAGEHTVVNPAATPAPVVYPASVPSVKQADIDTDYQTLQKREQGRLEIIENMRKKARENPDSNRVLTEDQLKKIEESGADFM